MAHPVIMAPSNSVRRFFKARPGGPRSRRGRRRLDSPRRDGRALRAQHHLRTAGGRGLAPPHTDKVFDCHLDDRTLRPLPGGLRQGRLHAIRELGKKAGVALNPATPESAIEYVLDQLDLILVMTVNPGFGGQAFIPVTVDKIARVKKLIGDPTFALRSTAALRPKPRRSSSAPAPTFSSPARRCSKAGRRPTPPTSPRSGPASERKPGPPDRRPAPTGSGSGSIIAG